MLRIGKLMVAALVVGAMPLAYFASAQQPAPRAPKAPPASQSPAGPRGSAIQQAEPAFPSVPSYYLLGMEQIQQELKLDQKQKDQIEQLSQNYTQQSQQELQALRETAPEERQQKLVEAQRRAAQRVETLRQKLEGVLTEKQLDELNQIAFRMAVPTALNNPQILDQLQVSEKQKEGLQKVRERTQEKLWGLEQDMAKESLQVLTPEQLKMLREMSQQKQAGGQ
jgi:hypothetical protein